MKILPRREIRFFHQINNYFCGPAIIVTVLAAHGIHTTQRKVARLARTNKSTGTSTAGLVFALRSFGIRAHADNGRTLRDVRHALRNGMTVIVCYTEPRSNWGHYAIVAGFRDGKILLLSPDERGKKATSMTLKEFKKRWKDDLFTRSKRWAAFI